MDRIGFTKALNQLVSEMIQEGESVVYDFVKRSNEEQKRLFNLGKSKCDGINRVSMHQLGMAADLYFLEGHSLSIPKKSWKFWHDRWEELGGEPVIDWDQGHFEGRPSKE